MYAAVTVDILNKQVDRPFTYRVPEKLSAVLAPGVPVLIPFGKGNQLRKGFVVELTEQCSLPVSQVKEIYSLDESAPAAEEELLSLAIWMRHRFGGTLFQCLSTVLPGKTKTEARHPRVFVYTGTEEELRERLALAVKKKHFAKKRLLEAFLDRRVLPAELVTDRLNISSATLKPFVGAGLVEIRNADEGAPGGYIPSGKADIPLLNEEQKAAVSGILSGEKTVSLLFGITGSGKTEVYLRLIEKVLEEGKQAIVLIPEIALTYQTVLRFYERFPGAVSVVHSRLSKGERCERFEKAKSGEIRVMIGPRSALFTPFRKPGIIIVDEFHENSYNSEQVPRYRTVETAVRRAEVLGGKVVLGSATPTIEAYEKALSGEYALYRLNHRAVEGAALPSVSVVDMREELRTGNRSVFSRALRGKIEDRLKKNEQIMLFLNRRGYSGSVSCRSCGEAMECPHCSVALNYHRDGSLQCHICGYRIPMVRSCPKCGSTLLGSFGIGTQKVEELITAEFPGIRALRMDADTTSGKEGHREILEKFGNGEADVLIGTQMIVKGHDFPNVTLVGILAADLSLNVPDYRSAEQTYELLTQAEGRAGRGQRGGECVVQTYHPEHYAVTAAARQDYQAFYESERLFRKQMKYPPFGNFLGLMVSGADGEDTKEFINGLCGLLKREFTEGFTFLGPTEAPVWKVKDMYRYLLYVKTDSLEKALLVKRRAEEAGSGLAENRRIYMSFYE